MPHHKALKKSVRTQSEARDRNRAYISNLRSLLKKARLAENPDEAQELTQQASSMLDRLSRKGILHKNKAANVKSKLAKRTNKLSA